MILWIITFTIVSLLFMLFAYVWKDASLKTKAGLLKHLQMFFISATVLLVILCVIVFLF